ncbi:MAG: hypothetical protein ACR2L2_02520 [Acidobacteriota bacterium]
MASALETTILARPIFAATILVANKKVAFDLNDDVDEAVVFGMVCQVGDILAQNGRNLLAKANQRIAGVQLFELGKGREQKRCKKKQGYRRHNPDSFAALSLSCLHNSSRSCYKERQHYPEICKPRSRPSGGDLKGCIDF